MHVVEAAFTGEPDILEAVKALGYSTLGHAVLARSVFPPPSIVAEIGVGPVVNAVRRGAFDGLGRVERRAYIPPADARRLFGIEARDPDAPGVYSDDNFCPSSVFMACFQVDRHQASTQLCHVFDTEHSQHPLYFTALPNLVLVPEWLAKLTDSDIEVQQLLRWAVRTVYAFCPACGAQASSHCDLCRPPAERPEESVVRALIAAHEPLRCKDYVGEFRRRYARQGRWKAAVDAGRGYKHPLMKP